MGSGEQNTLIHFKQIPWKISWRKNVQTALVSHKMGLYFFCHGAKENTHKLSVYGHLQAQGMRESNTLKIGLKRSVHAALAFHVEKFVETLTELTFSLYLL